MTGLFLAQMARQAFLVFQKLVSGSIESVAASLKYFLAQKLWRKYSVNPSFADYGAAVHSSQRNCLCRG